MQVKCEFKVYSLKENSSFMLGTIDMNSLLDTIHRIVYHAILRSYFSYQFFSWHISSTLSDLYQVRDDRIMNHLINLCVLKRQEL